MKYLHETHHSFCFGCQCNWRSAPGRMRTMAPDMAFDAGRFADDAIWIVPPSVVTCIRQCSPTHVPAHHCNAAHQQTQSTNSQCSCISWAQAVCHDETLRSGSGHACGMVALNSGSRWLSVVSCSGRSGAACAASTGGAPAPAVSAAKSPCIQDGGNCNQFSVLSTGGAPAPAVSAAKSPCSFGVLGQV